MGSPEGQTENKEHVPFPSYAQRTVLYIDIFIVKELQFNIISIN